MIEPQPLRSPVDPVSGSTSTLAPPPPPVPATAPAWESTAASEPPSSPVAGWGGRFARFAAVPVALQLRNFAIGGAVLGALIGLTRAALLHVPAGGIVVALLRMAVAGAAAGASLPAAVRALATLARAAGWIVLAIALGWLALALTGRMEWLQALAPHAS